MPEPSPAGPALLVEHDHAQLIYTGGMHYLTMRRSLANTGTQPVSRYLVRISVDRYPGDPERSNALYRTDPLTWDELNLHADCNGEAMTYMIKHDRDAFKEVWLAFANADNRFPLYPGERTWIEYSHSVSDAEWGRWFQRRPSADPAPLRSADLPNRANPRGVAGAPADRLELLGQVPRPWLDPGAQAPCGENHLGSGIAGHEAPAGLDSPV